MMEANELNIIEDIRLKIHTFVGRNKLIVPPSKIEINPDDFNQLEKKLITLAIMQGNRLDRFDGIILEKNNNLKKGEIKIVV